MGVVIVRPSNLYGPRDNFSPETSHVIPALIRRVYDETGNLFDVWGSGRQTRSFLYVTDAVSGMLAALEKIIDPEPLNLASPEEVTIGNLAKLVIARSGMDKTVRFLTDKPEGQMRKAASPEKTAKALGWQASTSLENGLRETIDWYKETMNGNQS